MKQKYLIFVLVIGLLAFSACTSNNNYMSNDEEVKQDNESMEVEDNQAVLVSGNYQVSPADSKVIWHGYRLVGNSHTGVVSVKSGSLQIADGVLAGGQFVIDVSSLKSDDDIESLEAHLKNEDFFDVANYPEAKLVITDAVPMEEANTYQVNANLTIKGITSTINFETELIPDVDSLSAKAEFNIDRTLWNLKYGSGKFFQDLGDKIISDDIEFKIDLKANLESEA